VPRKPKSKWDQFDDDLLIWGKFVLVIIGVFAVPVAFMAIPVVIQAMFTGDWADVPAKIGYEASWFAQFVTGVHYTPPSN
jgi:hypothetical protein